MKTPKETIAKIIRVLTVPPLMAAALILTMRVSPAGVIDSNTVALLSLLFLAVVPILAYPIAAAIKPLRDKGREGQRNTAFVMSVLGYTAAGVYGALSGLDAQVLFIYGTYFFSVALLLLCNKLLKLRASGHACSVVGPMLLIIYFVGGWAVPICLATYGASFWASVAIKRHTVREYLLGTLCCVLAGVISWLIYLG